MRKIFLVGEERLTSRSVHLLALTTVGPFIAVSLEVDSISSLL
jgi:hypothetical protein